MDLSQADHALLLEFLEDVTMALDQGDDVDVIYLDFCKAFDKVPHKRLLKKLWGYGIRGKIHTWVKDFLTNRTQQVKVNGSSSEPVKVTSGVPQGSVLGPVLFLIYINDLPDTTVAIMKLFADDAKIYRSISTVEHEQEVQVSVDQSETWAKIWEMFFNLKKCKHLHIGSRYQPTTYTMKSGQEQIEIEKVSNEKKSGCYHGPGIKVQWAYKNQINKANRNLGIVFITFTYMDKEMFLNLYKSIARPHLEYAATVCTPLFKKDMITVENVKGEPQN